MMRGAGCAVVLAGALIAGPGPTGPQDGHGRGPMGRLALAAPTCATGGAFLPPVQAAVADPFRPPAAAYGPGNRGLAYATRPGQEVHAIGAGVVHFAGRIGVAWYVTIAHDGASSLGRVSSTYSFLAAVTVRAGHRVRAGQVVGVTSDVGFHLGVRRDGTYVDPAPLLGDPGSLRPHLMPDRRFGDGGGCARSAR